MKRLTRVIPAVIAMSFFTACERDQINENLEGENLKIEITAIDTQTTEEAFPGRTATSEKVYYGLNEISVAKINGQYVFQGDILFAPEQIEKELGDSQRSTGRLGGRWGDNIVYYEIDPSLPNQRRVTDAIADWESNTAVRLVPRTTQPDYVYFTPGSGCSSYVGRIGGPQEITLANGCSTGNTIHEIGHAVGLWHEQSRVDRDVYLDINFQNIISGFEYNFYTYAQQGGDGNEFTGQLDFDSVMLYGSFAFTSNGQPTITKKDGSTYDVNRSSLSDGDIEGINQMYPGNIIGGGDLCDGLEPYSGGTVYNTGDRVIYQGSAYERNVASWTFIGDCGDEEPADICDGVAPYDPGTSYATGDRVTYQGNLYERLSNNGWRRLGDCG